MRVVSVNAGQPREARWRGRVVTSAIWKSPVVGRVRVGRLNLEGDRQADPAVHGGHEKAIYVYPSEHYAYWRAVLGELPFGAFGENLTTEGLTETEVRVGERLRMGSAILEVTQPRTPCLKLAMRFQRPSIVREFARSGRSGFYCAVIDEGDVAAGDPIAWAERSGALPTVADLFMR
jgi:MOSC domain-containing protein YiiM